MATFSFALWTVRRGWFGSVPRFFRLLGGLLFLFFVLFSAVALVVWAPLWNFLRLFHISQDEVQPIAAFAVIGVWFFGCMALVFRRFLRWMRKRYEHHGVSLSASAHSIFTSDGAARPDGFSTKHSSCLWNSLLRPAGNTSKWGSVAVILSLADQ